MQYSLTLSNSILAKEHTNPPEQFHSIVAQKNETSSAVLVLTISLLLGNNVFFWALAQFPFFLFLTCTFCELLWNAIKNSDQHWTWLCSKVTYVSQKEKLICDSIAGRLCVLRRGSSCRIWGGNKMYYFISKLKLQKCRHWLRICSVISCVRGFIKAKK